MQDSAGTRGLPFSVLKKVLLPYWHSIPSVAILTVTCLGFLVCFDFQRNLQSPHMQTFGLPQFEFSPMCMYISHSA